MSERRPVKSLGFDTPSATQPALGREALFSTKKCMQNVVILARLAVILDDLDVVQERLRKVLAIDSTLRTNMEADDYFQNIDLDNLL